MMPDHSCNSCEQSFETEIGLAMHNYLFHNGPIPNNNSSIIAQSPVNNMQTGNNIPASSQPVTKPQQELAVLNVSQDVMIDKTDPQHQSKTTEPKKNYFYKTALECPFCIIQSFLVFINEYTIKCENCGAVWKKPEAIVTHHERPIQPESQAIHKDAPKAKDLEPITQIIPEVIPEPITQPEKKPEVVAIVTSSEDDATLE